MLREKSDYEDFYEADEEETADIIFKPEPGGSVNLPYIEKRNRRHFRHLGYAPEQTTIATMQCLPTIPERYSTNFQAGLHHRKVLCYTNMSS